MTTVVGIPVSKSVVTMSSREVAELTQKQHGHVCRDVEKMLEELNESADQYIHNWTHPQNGQIYREFCLDRDHVECLLVGYSSLLRMKVIRRLRELENKTSVPQTLPEALRLAADLAEEKQQLENQLSIAAPKVEFVDRYVKANGSMTFRQVAKLLNAKEHEFICFLQDNHVMYRLNGTLTPRQPHSDLGRFEVKTGTNSVNNHAFTQARFTPKGVKWIGGLWSEYLAKKGAA
ncbi:phage regulatory protein/antirepressor Ant [Yersinia canariae]|uniref:Phage regulatory protein/antirepressor Ant n=1 Tax=Yersinia canariae TaxID=2607663 RepID=A0A857EWR2_9GAMM|nr:phage antirepressor KilAC domain-containing protein [Yersinia canariae]QHB31857.1 phage regulatory protein/antirepressor Ant [Yersinia canariae]